MNQLKKQLQNLNKSYSDNDRLTAFIHNKGNAKLGDALVNFLYSVAKSVVSEKPTGAKVSDSILSEAYKKSLWYSTRIIKLRGNKDRIADAIEALILYFWIFENLGFNEFVDPLIVQLDPDRLYHPKVEHSSAVVSFQSLLDYLYQRYHESSNKDKKHGPKIHQT